MSFLDKLSRARAVLAQHGRLSLRALGRELEAEAEELEDLVAELVEVQQVARRDGQVLVNLLPSEVVPVPGPTPSATITVPIARPGYTPGHLAERILRSKSALEGERKQVTVLFADMKGSLALAERIDPEEWHRLLDRFFAILADGIRKHLRNAHRVSWSGWVLAAM